MKRAKRAKGIDRAELRIKRAMDVVHDNFLNNGIGTHILTRIGEDTDEFFFVYAPGIEASLEEMLNVLRKVVIGEPERINLKPENERGVELWCVRVIVNNVQIGRVSPLTDTWYLEIKQEG